MENQVYFWAVLSLLAFQACFALGSENCTAVDKNAVHQKVLLAIQDAVEKLFQDPNSISKVLRSTDSGIIKRKNKSESDEELSGHSKRASNIQIAHDSRDEANATIVHHTKTGNSTDTNMQVATADGKTSGTASAVLVSRATRSLCFPLQYGEEVKKLVKKVVDEAFKNLVL